MTALRTRSGGPGRRIAVVLFNLAVSLEHISQVDEAEAVYSQAVERDPENARILTGWGIAAFHRKEFQAASERLEAASRSASACSGRVTSMV